MQPESFFQLIRHNDLMGLCLPPISPDGPELLSKVMADHPEISLTDLANILGIVRDRPRLYASRKNKIISRALAGDLAKVYPEITEEQWIRAFGFEPGPDELPETLDRLLRKHRLFGYRLTVGKATKLPKPSTLTIMRKTRKAGEAPAFLPAEYERVFRVIDEVVAEQEAANKNHGRPAERGVDELQLLIGSQSFADFIEKKFADEEDPIGALDRFIEGMQCGVTKNLTSSLRHPLVKAQ